MDLPQRHRLAAAAALLALAVVAVPALAGALPAMPAAPDAPAASPDASDKPGRGPKDEKARVASTPVTLTGRVGTTQDEDGRPVYTLTVGSTVYTLHAGPPWWWGDSHPLASTVGDTVTIEGEQADGTNDVDVFTVDGTVIREPGRPDWAGGPKAVGERHPGWSAEKAERWAEKAERGHGRPDWAGPKASAAP